MTMTAQEKELYITMVEMFIEHYPDVHCDDDGKPCRDCYNVRAWQAMRVDLIALGLAEGHYAKSSLLVPASEARKMLEASMPASAPPFKKLLDDWMYLFSSYHDVWIPTTRRPFTLGEPYTKILPLFIALGYMLNEAELYIWSDKIAPAMCSFHQWTEDLEDIEDWEALELQNEAGRMLALLNSDARNSFKREEIGTVTVWVAQYWDGERWNWDNDKKPNSFQYLSAKPLALALTKKLAAPS